MIFMAGNWLAGCVNFGNKIYRTSQSITIHKYTYVLIASAILTLTLHMITPTHTHTLRQGSHKL